MAVSIGILDVSHNSLPLEMLPVEGNISLLLSYEPDLDNYEDIFFLVRTEATQDLINIGDALIRSVGDVTYDNYDLIEIAVSGSTVANGYEVTIDPQEPLLENANYTLVISKNLVPRYYAVAKPITLGTSNISVETNPYGISEDAVYEIEITGQSQLTTTQHLITVEISKNALVIESNRLIDVKSEVLELNTATSVRFAANVPFLNTEKFSIALEEFTPLGTTMTEPFNTLPSTIITETPEYNSTKVENSDIISWYEQTGFSKRIEDQQQQAIPATITFKYPNVFIVDFPVEIDYSSVTADSFTIDITEAFGNYILGPMGLYDEAKKYRIDVTSITSMQIKLTLVADNTLVATENFEIVIL